MFFARRSFIASPAHRRPDGGAVTGVRATASSGRTYSVQAKGGDTHTDVGFNGLNAATVTNAVSLRSVVMQATVGPHRVLRHTPSLIGERACYFAVYGHS